MLHRTTTAEPHGPALVTAREGVVARAGTTATELAARLARSPAGRARAAPMRPEGHEPVVSRSHHVRSTRTGG